MVDEQRLAERSAEVMWGADAASRALGMELVAVGPGSAVVTLSVRADMVNGWDLCHGGLVAALADGSGGSDDVVIAEFRGRSRSLGRPIEPA